MTGPGSPIGNPLALGSHTACLELSASEASEEVSTVGLVCRREEVVTGRAWLHQTGSMVEIEDEEGCDAGCPAADRDPPSRTLLTVPTVFSRVARIRMILFPARPSRLKAMSMPTARRKV